MTRRRHDLESPRHRPWTATPIPPRRAGTTQTLAVLVGALLLGALLNAEPLALTAASQTAGWQRDIAVELSNELVTISRMFHLNRPRAWLDDVLGRSPDEPTPTTSPHPTPPGRPTPSPRASPTSAPSLSPTPQASPTPRPVPDLLATRAAPARLWVVGDSMTETFGPALVNLALATEVVVPEHDLRYSSGLTRPDFYDWPAHLREHLGGPPVDIVVFMIGANDAQSIQVGSTWVDFGTAGWIQEYRRRVDEAATVLGTHARTVYWVGQPIARSDSYGGRMALLNRIYEDIADRHLNVRYVSSWDLFRAEDGGYADYLPDATGKPTLVRARDGIHLTQSGGAWLATHVLDTITEDWTFDRTGQHSPPDAKAWLVEGAAGRPATEGPMALLHTHAGGEARRAP